MLWRIPENKDLTGEYYQQQIDQSAPVIEQSVQQVTASEVTANQFADQSISILSQPTQRSEKLRRLISERNGQWEKADTSEVVHSSKSRFSISGLFSVVFWSALTYACFHFAGKLDSWWVENVSTCTGTDCSSSSAGWILYFAGIITLLKAIFAIGKMVKR